MHTQISILIFQQHKKLVSNNKYAEDIKIIPTQFDTSEKSRCVKLPLRPEFYTKI